MSESKRNQLIEKYVELFIKSEEIPEPEIELKEITEETLKKVLKDDPLYFIKIQIRDNIRMQLYDECNELGILQDVEKMYLKNYKDLKMKSDPLKR